MRIKQHQFTSEQGWSNLNEPEAPDATWGLAFGTGALLADRAVMQPLRDRYPNARWTGCSTAGEIAGIQVDDDTVVATAVELETSRIELVTVDIEDPSESFVRARELAESLESSGLRHVFVLSDGLTVNGSQFVSGIANHLPEGVQVTGGLAADGDRFESTSVLIDGQPSSNMAVAVGLYGDDLQIGHGSLGGWDAFGPARLITKAKANVLYELDGKPALELYKRYLGEHATGLPATGLLFPLSVELSAGDRPVVRTILAVDESEGSMTFAGDVPEGAKARLMKANFDRLVDGAAGAARDSAVTLASGTADLGILISCVGRKLVLQQRVEEEVEAVREVLGDAPVLTGFYSYGEISPYTADASCNLHNQTMTITTIREG